LPFTFLHLLDQFFDVLCFCYVCCYADGFAFDVGELVKARDGLVDTLCTAVLARGNYDSSGAGEEESCCSVETETARSCERYRSELELESNGRLGGGRTASNQRDLAVKAEHAVEVFEL